MTYVEIMKLLRELSQEYLDIESMLQNPKLSPELRHQYDVRQEQIADSLKEIM